MHLQYVNIAVVADTHTKYSDRAEAQRLGTASLGMSISGIIVTVIIVAIAVGVSVSSYNRATSCMYTANGGCYSSRRYVGSCSYYSASYCCYSYEDVYYASYCYTSY